MTPNLGLRADLKIGTNKGRPRIWIDGARLTEAGFTPGREYACYASDGMIECSLLMEGQKREFMPDPTRTNMRCSWRKVSGRPGGKPIIDMLGRDVEHSFPGAARVLVIFRHRYLAIIERVTSPPKSA
jgi:hypothetical protein